MKKSIRKEIIQKRDKITADVKKIKDSMIKQRLFNIDEFISSKKILFYASFRSEVETLSMIKESIEMGKNVVLPKVNKLKHELGLYEIKDINELYPGYMGILEPFVKENRLVTIDDVDFVVIPGIAFDYTGNRLGYGGGYYDILLSEKHVKSPVVALAYEEQIINSIPSEMHDIKVDMIVTDKRLIKR